MKLLLGVLYASALLCGGEAQHLDEDAEDCIVYEGVPVTDDSSLSYVKEFQHGMSVGVSPLTNMMAGELQVSSFSSNHTCSIQFIAEVIVVSCTDHVSVTRNSGTHKWPLIFAERDTTELWLQVGEEKQEEVTPATDLLLVGRRGRHRGHLVFPSSGLQPPLRVQWKALQNMNYYFNCVTGCLYTRVVKTQPGEHSVFLRQRESNLEMTLTYASNARGQHVVNVTSNDLGPLRDLKNLTLVWNDHAGTTGLLVDGTPVGNLTRYSALNEAGEVVAAVIEGPGFVSRCAPRFQGVSNIPCPGGVATDGDLTATSTLSATSTTASPSDAAGGSGVGVIAMLLVMALAFLATTLLFAVLYHRAARRLQRLQKKSNTTSSSTSTPRTSSVRSSHRRKEPASTEVNEEATSISEATAALSDTVVTPVPTPGSLSDERASKFVSTKDFLDLDLL